VRWAGGRVWPRRRPGRTLPSKRSLRAGVADRVTSAWRRGSRSPEDLRFVRCRLYDEQAGLPRRFPSHHLLRIGALHLPTNALVGSVVEENPGRDDARRRELTRMLRLDAFPSLLFRSGTRDPQPASRLRGTPTNGAPFSCCSPAGTALPTKA